MIKKKHHLTYTIAKLFILAIGMIYGLQTQAQTVYKALSDRYQTNLINEYENIKTVYNNHKFNEISSPKELYNYYLATKFSAYTSNYNPEVTLNSILLKLKSIAPNSFEYHFINFIHSNDPSDKNGSLEKAYQIDPSRQETWDDLLLTYHINAELEKAKKLAQKILVSSKYSAEIYNYQKNVAASCENNSIIITQGEIDTAPLLTLLYTGQIKKKLKLYKVDNSISISKLISRIKGIAPNESIYFALTVKHQTLSILKNDLYLTGLAFKYSPNLAIDNIAICKNNFFDNFQSNYLFNNNIRSAEIKLLNKNYTPMLKMIKEYYPDLKKTELKQINSLLNNLNK